MNQSILEILIMLDRNKIDQCVSLKSILGNLTNGVNDLRPLAEQGLIQPFDREQFDPQSDFEEQFKMGIRITQDGQNFLLRQRFLF